MAESPTIALVSDVHFGPDHGTVHGSDADERLERILARIGEHAPDLLVDLGDRLSEEAAAADASRLWRLAEVFDRTGLPRAHIVGNHDLVHNGRDEAESILSSRLHSYSRDLGGWHLVFWNAKCVFPDLQVPQEDLAWLRDDLASTRLPAAVFAHVPLGGASTVGNRHFQEDPAGRATYFNAAEAREILCASATCKVAFGGHQHWSTLHTVDGVHFVTIPAVSETFTTHPHPADAWALAELGERVHVRVFGRDRREYVLPVRATGEHWLIES